MEKMWYEYMKLIYMYCGKYILSKWRSSQYVLNLSSWGKSKPEKKIQAWTGIEPMTFFTGLLFPQLLKLSTYCDDLHLLKMYFPQYKYMSFIYSYHIFSIHGYITNCLFIFVKI